MRKQLVARIVALLAVVAGLSIYDFPHRPQLMAEAGRSFPGREPERSVGAANALGIRTHCRTLRPRHSGRHDFSLGLVYCLWLRSADRNWGSRRLIHGLPFTLRGFALAAIVAGLLMTQSRGPWSA